ncbi:hypothetical protein KP509_35G016400 [Ceratopteris richardii]|uniref:Uncharacterized protein n=1 Tax=Ceratopteris richardii TaxID=49495 RepID=A0A8T2QEX5_CERRI|nr:hypothetical protein KP509_35G016400 [Ceratopteris richardii]
MYPSGIYGEATYCGITGATEIMRSSNLIRDFIHALKMVLYREGIQSLLHIRDVPDTDFSLNHVLSKHHHNRWRDILLSLYCMDRFIMVFMLYVFFVLLCCKESWPLHSLVCMEKPHIVYYLGQQNWGLQIWKKGFYSCSQNGVVQRRDIEPSSH